MAKLSVIGTFAEVEVVHHASTTTDTEYHSEPKGAAILFYGVELRQTETSCCARYQEAYNLLRIRTNNLGLLIAHTIRSMILSLPSSSTWRDYAHDSLRQIII